MSKIIKLPSGNTVTLKDRTDFTLKDRKYVLREVKQDELNDIGDMLNILERVAVVMIEEWSYDLVPPNIKPESLDGLKTSDIDAILREARQALPDLMPQLDGPADGAEPDPKVITPNSED
jgi:hypothetical protein